MLGQAREALGQIHPQVTVGGDSATPTWAHRSSSGATTTPEWGPCWQQPTPKGAAVWAAGARQGCPCASGISCTYKGHSWERGLSTQLDTSSFLGA